MNVIWLALVLPGKSSQRPFAFVKGGDRQDQRSVRCGGGLLKMLEY